MQTYQTSYLHTEEAFRTQVKTRPQCGLHQTERWVHAHFPELGSNKTLKQERSGQQSSPKTLCLSLQLGDTPMDTSWWSTALNTNE